jgi:hypothetical protein
LQARHARKTGATLRVDIHGWKRQIANTHPHLSALPKKSEILPETDIHQKLCLGLPRNLRLATVPKSNVD